MRGFWVLVLPLRVCILPRGWLTTQAGVYKYVPESGWCSRTEHDKPYNTARTNAIWCVKESVSDVHVHGDD